MGKGTISNLEMEWSPSHVGLIPVESTQSAFSETACGEGIGESAVYPLVYVSQPRLLRMVGFKVHLYFVDTSVPPF